MGVLEGIGIAFLVVFVAFLLFIFQAEIEALIAFIIFGLVIPIWILSFSFNLIKSGNQSVGGFLIGIVIIWWLIIGFFLKDEFLN